jgi:hypothetical protein
MTDITKKIGLCVLLAFFSLQSQAGTKLTISESGGRIQGFTSQAVNASRVLLYPNLDANGNIINFPPNGFDLQVTTSDCQNWIDLGNYLVMPRNFSNNGAAVVPFAQEFQTCGVMVSPLNPDGTLNQNGSSTLQDIVLGTGTIEGQFQETPLFTATNFSNVSQLTSGTWPNYQGNSNPGAEYQLDTSNVGALSASSSNTIGTYTGFFPTNMNGVNELVTGSNLSTASAVQAQGNEVGLLLNSSGLSNGSTEVMSLQASFPPGYQPRPFAVPHQSLVMTMNAKVATASYTSAGFFQQPCPNTPAVEQVNTNFALIDTSTNLPLILSGRIYDNRGYCGWMGISATLANGVAVILTDYNSDTPMNILNGSGQTIGYSQYAPNLDWANPASPIYNFIASFSLALLNSLLPPASNAFATLSYTVSPETLTQAISEVKVYWGNQDYANLSSNLSDYVVQGYSVASSVTNQSASGQLGVAFQNIQFGTVSEFSYANNAIGNLDGFVYNEGGISGESIAGWTCIKNDTSSIRVHLYAGAPGGQGGELIGSAIANQSSEQAVQQACGVNSGAFRFYVPVTKSMIKHHGGAKIYAQGISPAGDYSPAIPGSGGYTVPEN